MNASFFWSFAVLYEIQIDSGVASNTENQVALIIEQLRDQLCLLTNSTDVKYLCWQTISCQKIRMLSISVSDW